jgi:hypothetical protein
MNIQEQVETSYASDMEVYNKISGRIGYVMYIGGKDD